MNIESSAPLSLAPLSEVFIQSVPLRGPSGVPVVGLDFNSLSLRRWRTVKKYEFLEAEI